MKGSWAIIFAAMLLASCRSSQPTTNPFLRTTVAPPATGQAAVVVPTEPYSTTPPIITTPPPPSTMPVTTVPVQGAPGTPAMTPAVPRGGDKISPPGGSYLFHQSKAEQPKQAGASDIVLASATEPMPESHSPAATTLKLTAEDPQSQESAENRVLKLATPLAAAEQATADPTDDAQSRGHPLVLSDADDSGNSVRIVGEAAGSAGVSKPSPAASNATAAAKPVLRITAGEGSAIGVPAFREVSSSPGSEATLTASSAESSPTNTAQFVAAGVSAASSGVVQTAFQPSANASPATGTAQYAHSADYSELRGRLEYSQTARQWKLRYIPIDGETDKYGGSVILSDAALLASYQAGDLVTIRGVLAPAATSQAGFSPSYQAHQITRIGR